MLWLLMPAISLIKVFLGTSYDFNISSTNLEVVELMKFHLFTPQGRAKGKRNEDRKPEPVNKKKNYLSKELLLHKH